MNAPDAQCPFSQDVLPEAAEARSFWLSESHDPVLEAQIFLHQMARETGMKDIERRIDTMKDEVKRTGLWNQTSEELTFGARVAWRNSIRCIGRMFWPSLKVFDARSLTRPDEIFEAILAHIRWSTNSGDLRPALTVFRPGEPRIRILNPQLILYAGYLAADGKVLGDPKNVKLTNFAMKMGWRGDGTEFDILPIVLKVGEQPPELIEIPQADVLQVKLQHPERPEFAQLGLKWFALPAVSGMALDLGGVQYSAAPSSGVYQGTEIGCINLGDPRRYAKLDKVAAILGLDTSLKNPLWRDQAMVELNRAVLHSFRQAGVRIMDHHALSESFLKFRRREAEAGREVFGHWPWLVPPMSSNLAAHWHDPTLKRVIQKPGYFYQPAPELMHC